MTKLHLIAVSVLAALCTISLGDSAKAASCMGNCGIMGANGSITAPPGGSLYHYVSTDGGVAGAGRITSAGGVDGSAYTTDVVAAKAGDRLSFYVNYITSDGTSYSDYSFAELLSSSGSSLGLLLSARTVIFPGNTSPGFGLPANISVLTPGATAISGGTTWAPLGTSSTTCFGGLGKGCGNTGWVKATYTFTTAGTFAVRFGVTNIGDADQDSGLAFTDLVVGELNAPDTAAVPEPATWAMTLIGFGLLGAAQRRHHPFQARRSSAARSTS